MWLLTSEPQSASLVLSHDPGASPVIRLHQPFGSWACSSQRPPLLPPTFIQSTAVYFALSTNQRLYSIYSPHIYCISGNSSWVTSLPIPHPTPKKGGKIYNFPVHPATKQLHICNFCIMWQILSAIRPTSSSVWLPSIISILSKSPKPQIVSCFYPALCSFYDKSSFQSRLTASAVWVLKASSVQLCKKYKWI